MKAWLLCVFLCAGNFAQAAKPAGALNPMSPATLCDRFIADRDKKTCELKAEKLDLDWYAATVCNLLESDDQFMRCWAEVDGKVFSPPDLIECVSDDLLDEARRDCLNRVSLRTAAPGRVPASQRSKKSSPMFQEFHPPRDAR